MCGILGLVDPGARPDLRAALPLLAHRGPDDEGSFWDDDCFLGARRLSIIDVAGGHQPLNNEDGRVWAVQNGEIYNYLAVRAELEALGHTFKTRSDTEVIVHAYEAWGAACAEHLRGIFAFAVWDAAERRLLLARDRFGVKPLYTLQLPGGALAFASEARPLLGLLPGGAQPDPTALRALFEFGFIPTPHTAFAGLRKLPAAHTLTLHAGRADQRRYWDAAAPPALANADDTVGREAPSWGSPVGTGSTAPAPGPTAGGADMAEGLLEHLRRAVSEQRMSEVPLGALISGGLDSTTIAALLQAQQAAPLRTFNIGFEHDDFNEAAHAALAAERIGTHHTQLDFTEADFDLYPEVLRRLEEPQCSATALPIYLLYRACGQAGLKVVLTGEGADELLGGYHWYRGDALVRRLLWLPGPLRRRLARFYRVPMSPPARRALAGGARSTADRYADWQGPGPLADLLLPGLRDAPCVLPEWRAALRDGAAGRDPFRQMQYLETLTRLPDFINFEVDRMSMAHGVEARVPFLDHELWEYCARLPSAALLAGKLSKALLRQAAAGLVPPEILARRKQGLAAPYNAWLRRPRLPAWAEDALTPSALARAGLFSPAAVARLRAVHQSGRANHSRALMGVLSTQLWWEAFVG